MRESRCFDGWERLQYFWCTWIRGHVVPSLYPPERLNEEDKHKYITEGPPDGALVKSGAT
jgi:hypothetical protein